MTDKKVGRPRAFKTEIELREKIAKYFEYCKQNDEPLLMIGLILFLDVDTDTFYKYSNGEYDDAENDFSATCKKAKMKVQKDKWIGGLTGKYNPAITIFDLKNNHGCTDKVENVNKYPNGHPLENINFNVLNGKDV